ncbi:hypothetical protein [Crocosphaera sp. XPORK-15E]|uniref:hypothetical protein n=1 Tax=Crocosphaera sp. XPORK-15E TaxID=3110247 RepID=UPI002B20C5E6|nr:hypothetical protein [Crocosphaera sp. XPORK-15E]MEA5535676.1 hypothetical protein [Crocosphaera sp. XPORK-15E]
MTEVALFSPHQIVCLEHDDHRLYCEVIQVVELRQRCWVRPLFLAVIAEDRQVYHQLSMPKVLIDVRSTSDLLYPITLFRVALDTEVIPLLTEIETQKTSPESRQEAKEKLRQFITQVWQDHPEKFS